MLVYKYGCEYELKHNISMFEKNQLTKNSLSWLFSSNYVHCRPEFHFVPQSNRCDCDSRRNNEEWLFRIRNRNFEITFRRMPNILGYEIRNPELWKRLLECRKYWKRRCIELSIAAAEFWLPVRKESKF